MASGGWGCGDVDSVLLFYSGVIESLEPALALLLGVLLAGRVVAVGVRLVARGLGR